MPDERAGNRGQERKPRSEEKKRRRERTRGEGDSTGLRHENERLQRRNERLRRENDRLKRKIDHLEKQLATARRAGFRQAAPFAKDRPQGGGGHPGRRAGAAYGRQASRPRPAQVDEQLTEDELGLYREWIENNRELERLVKEMRRISSQVLALITGRQAP